MYLLIAVMVVYYSNSTTSQVLIKEFVPGKEACEQFQKNILKSYRENRPFESVYIDARCIPVEGE